MTSTSHASAEQLADLLEGTSPPGEASRLTVHIASCSDCRDLLDALQEVTAVLAAAGATDEPMPADVAASVQAALREASGRAEPVGRAPIASIGRSAPGGRASGTRRRGAAGSRRPLAWLAGAAAAAVVASAGIAGWRALPLDGLSGSGAAAGRVSSQLSPGAQPTGGNAGAGTYRPLPSAAPGPAHNTRLAPPALSPGSVADAAQQLVRLRRDGTTVPSLRHCTAPAGYDASELILWRGAPAVLIVKGSSRTATVVDCATGRRVLFTTRY